MSGGWAWVAGVWLAVGSNGWWLDAKLATSHEMYRQLVPMAWLDDTTGSLWFAFHRLEDGSMAVYLPPDAEEMRWARAFPQQAGQQFERLLPQLEVPRVVLRESVYRHPDGLVDPASLAVDSAEHFYNALLEAHVDLALRRGRPWTEALTTRADDAMARVPAPHRAEAYRAAVVDFASHVLSLAGEIARQSRRLEWHRLCAVLDRPATLFGAWSRSLGDGQFPGRWYRPVDPETGLGGTWETTRDLLRPSDKRWVLETLLGATWTGDPRVDFSRFCALETLSDQGSRRTGEMDSRAGSLTSAR